MTPPSKAFREESAFIEILDDVSPGALDEVPSEFTPVLFVLLAGQDFGEFTEVRPEEGQKGSEGFFLPAVRGGGDQDHVPAGV